MSPRIEILRRLNAAFNAREEGWTRFYAENAEFLMPPEWPDMAVLRGRTGIEEGAGLWRENLDDYRWDEDRLIETEDFVVGLYHHRGRIRGPDQQVETQIGALFFFEGDAVVRAVSYTSWAEALATAGIDG